MEPFNSGNAQRTDIYEAAWSLSDAKKTLVLDSTLAERFVNSQRLPNELASAFQRAITSTLTRCCAGLGQNLEATALHPDAPEKVTGVFESLLLALLCMDAALRVTDNFMRSLKLLLPAFRSTDLLNALLLSLSRLGSLDSRARNAARLESLATRCLARVCGILREWCTGWDSHYSSHTVLRKILHFSTSLPKDLFPGLLAFSSLEDVGKLIWGEGEAAFVTFSSNVSVGAEEEEAVVSVGAEEVRANTRCAEFDVLGSEEQNPISCEAEKNYALRKLGVETNLSLNTHVDLCLNTMRGVFGSTSSTDENTTSCIVGDSSLHGADAFYPVREPKRRRLIYDFFSVPDSTKDKIGAGLFSRRHSTSYDPDVVRRALIQENRFGELSILDLKDFTLTLCRFALSCVPQLHAAIVFSLLQLFSQCRVLWLPLFSKTAEQLLVDAESKAAGLSSTSNSEIQLPLQALGRLLLVLEGVSIEAGKEACPILEQDCGSLFDLSTKLSDLCTSFPGRGFERVLEISVRMWDRCVQRTTQTIALKNLEVCRVRHLCKALSAHVLERERLDLDLSLAAFRLLVGLYISPHYALHVLYQKQVARYAFSPAFKLDVFALRVVAELTNAPKPWPSALLQLLEGCCALGLLVKADGANGRFESGKVLGTEFFSCSLDFLKEEVVDLQKILSRLRQNEADSNVSPAIASEEESDAAAASSYFTRLPRDSEDRNLALERLRSLGLVDDFSTRKFSPTVPSIVHRIHLAAERAEKAMKRGHFSSREQSLKSSSQEWAFDATLDRNRKRIETAQAGVKAKQNLNENRRAQDAEDYWNSSSQNYGQYYRGGTKGQNARALTLGGEQVELASLRSQVDANFLAQMGQSTVTPAPVPGAAGLAVVPKPSGVLTGDYSTPPSVPVNSWRSCNAGHSLESVTYLFQRMGFASKPRKKKSRLAGSSPVESAWASLWRRTKEGPIWALCDGHRPSTRCPGQPSTVCQGVLALKFGSRSDPKISSDKSSS